MGIKDPNSRNEISDRNSLSFGSVRAAPLALGCFVRTVVVYVGNRWLAEKSIKVGNKRLGTYNSTNYV